MTQEQGMTITQIIRFAETEKCGIDNLAIVCGGESGRPFEVQHDYGDANVSYWETHEEARTEAGRLWLTGAVSRVEDHIVAAAERRTFPEEYAAA
ncbi:hypothetical protein RMR21_005455 [Agrobacterium sp. rho-8.1]|nr:hypothetical protein [Agrobacterium sp. rho-8.1]